MVKGEVKLWNFIFIIIVEINLFEKCFERLNHLAHIIDDIMELVEMDNTMHKWCKVYLFKKCNNQLHEDYVVKFKYNVRKYNINNNIDFLIQ